MHEDEIPVDEALVRRLLISQFPEWAHLPLERVQSTGTVNALYRLGDDMCARLPLIHWGAGDVEREQRWLPYLRPHLPLGVPELLEHGRPEDGYPWSWGIYKWLKGETMLVEHLIDPDLAAADLAKFVVALREIDPTDGPPSGRGKPLAERDSDVRTVLESLGDTIDTGAVTKVWEASLAAARWSGESTWTHGDLLPSNLLVGHGRLVAVIDFGAVGVGDPACDLIAAWSVFADGSRQVFRKALEVDEQTWLRGRGWALAVALPIIPYYVVSNPAFVSMAIRMVDEILADYRAAS